MISNDILKNYRLLNSYSGLSLSSVERLLGISRRNLTGQIQRIDQMMADIGESERVDTKDDVLRMPHLTVEEILRRIPKGSRNISFQEERPYIIFLYLLLTEDFTSSYHFQDLFHMSRNSVISDINLLNRELGEELAVKYRRDIGYYIEGTTEKVLRFTQTAVARLLGYQWGEWIFHFLMEVTGRKSSSDLIREMIIGNPDIKFVDERVTEIVHLVDIVSSSRVPGLRTDDEKDEHTEQIEQIENMELTEHMEGIKGEESDALHDGDADEGSTALLEAEGIALRLADSFPTLVRLKGYITALLLGSMQGRLKDSSDPELVRILDRIIANVRSQTGIDFPQETDFRETLYNHLAPAYYRMKFGTELENPVKEDIIRNYRSLYLITRRCLHPLEESLGKKISDDEMAYFTMHIGGYLSLPEEGKRIHRAIVICPNGISSSLIIREQLRNTMPEIDITGVYSMLELDHIKEPYDMVFSTRHLVSDRKVYLVSTFMNPLEKTYLKRKVYEDFSIQTGESATVKDVMDIVEKHGDIADRESLEVELSLYFSQKGKVKESKEERGLDELLNEELIVLRDSVADWREGIRQAAVPLLDGGYIESGYVDSMIRTVEELGPYIVLVPKVAVPHARPDGNVNKVGFSMLKLKEPVSFRTKEEDDENDVYLIIALAAVDSTSHLKALQELAGILDDENSIDEMIAAQNGEEVMKIIRRKLEEKKC